MIVEEQISLLTAKPASISAVVSKPSFQDGGFGFVAHRFAFCTVSQVNT